MPNFQPDNVGLIGCRIMNVNLQVGQVPEGEHEYSNNVNVSFDFIANDDPERPIGLDVMVFMQIDEGAVFSLDITGRVLFDIPAEFSNQDAHEFLAKPGAQRAFDCVRPHIEYLTAFSGFEMIPVPPLVIQID